MRRYPAENPASDRFRLLFMGLLVFLLHGAKLNSDLIGIDTEDIIHLEDGFYGGWLHTGRQGLVLLKILWGNRRFNPYFSGLMTLLLFSASVGAFFLLWDRAGGRAGRARRDAGLWAWGLGGLLWISHPVMAEQFYFALQSMEICVCLLLTAAALYLSLCWAGGSGREHGLWEAVGSVLLLLITFSGYQVFVVLYIFGAVSLLLLQALGEIRAHGFGRRTDAARGGTEKELSPGRLLGRVVFYVVIFLAAFLLNTLITQLFFSSSGYLRDQIFWGQASVKDCIYAIGAHVVKVFAGVHSVFYQAGFGVLALCDLVLLVWFLRRSAGGRKGIWGVVLFYYLSLLAAPFLMTFLLGGAPAARSQLVLPAAEGFLGYLGLWLCGRLAEGRAGHLESVKGWAGGRGHGGPEAAAGRLEPVKGGAEGRGHGGPEGRAGAGHLEPVKGGAGGRSRRGTGSRRRHGTRGRAAALVLAAVCLWSGVEQAKVTAALYYTDSCRYAQDAALGRALIERVRQVNLGDDGVPLIVVGRRRFSGSHACVMGEVIGRSFFDYDTEVEPVSFWSTRRVLGFLHTLGAEFGQAPEERIEEALEYSTYMPEWPAADSVQEKDGMIIIKLSHYE